MLPIAKRVVVITGSGKGIDRAVASEPDAYTSSMSGVDPFISSRVGMKSLTKNSCIVTSRKWNTLKCYSSWSYRHRYNKNTDALFSSPKDIATSAESLYVLSGSGRDLMRSKSSLVYGRGFSGSILY